MPRAYHHITSSLIHTLFSFRVHPIDIISTREVFNEFTSLSLMFLSQEACRWKSTTKVGGCRCPHDVSLLDVSSILATGSWAQKKGADERPQAFVNLCMDGYTGHLIGAPFSLLETVCVGDLGNRTRGDRICWDLFGKPTEKTRMVRRKTRGKGTKEMLKACTRLRANKAFLGNFLGEFVAQSYLWVDKDGFLWETFLPKLVRSFVSENMDLIPRSLGSIQCS